MNYIPFPRLDKDSHPDLVKWRSNTQKSDNDWKQLRDFLHECTKILNASHSLPKCWYSELPQGDNNALDVEHFRPKNSGSPLTKSQIRDLNKIAVVKFEQNEIEGSYSWLKFDYRNYRLVTALTNRAGAKHLYFPIAKGGDRLVNGQLPWETTEYSYFLDPTCKEDTALLFIKPNGEISPITPFEPLTDSDYLNLPETWRNRGFNYLRAIVTIKMFRLNDTVFIQGRKEVYDATIFELECLDIALYEKSELINKLIDKIVQLLLPSAPFSLAAKSAVKAFQSTRIAVSEFDSIKTKILNRIETAVNNIVIDWSKN